MHETERTVVSVLENEPDHYIFWCLGCRCAHYFKVPPWIFNGDMEKPTVRASILVRGVVDAATDPTPTRCHLFLTDGRIDFLNDCTHHLKGQTVPMEALP